MKPRRFHLDPEHIRWLHEMKRIKVSQGVIAADRRQSPGVYIVTATASSSESKVDVAQRG